MPTWNEILNKLQVTENPIDKNRRDFLKQLSAYTGRNVIVYYSGWLQKENLIQKGIRFDIVDADKLGFMSTVKGLKKDKGLDLILHTPGGSIAATESIVHYLRSIFGTNIRAIVPQIAMSAGTMIALSCEEILMGKHSNLGPIDPQLGGHPTHGIIEEFKKAREEIVANPATIPFWQSILAKYPPAFVGECDKAIKWSETMVQEWLKTGMFKDEKDNDSKRAKISEIVKALGSHEETHSHSRPIHVDKLTDLGVKVTPIESDQTLQDLILSVHHSCIITFSQTPSYKIIENHDGKAFIQITN